MCVCALTYSRWHSVTQHTSQLLELLKPVVPSFTIIVQFNASCSYNMHFFHKLLYFDAQTNYFQLIAQQPHKETKFSYELWIVLNKCKVQSRLFKKNCIPVDDLLHSAEQLFFPHLYLQIIEIISLGGRCNSSYSPLQRLHLYLRL